MKIVKYSYFIVLLLLLCNCSNIKSLYEKKEVEINDKRSSLLIKKFELGNIRSILYFTESFNNDNVKVFSHKTIIFDRKLETIEQLGYAGSCIVDNNIDVLITINDKNIILPTKKLKLYKFIYITKEDEKYIVFYTNKAKSFL